MSIGARRSSLQQQLASSEAEAGAVQSSLAEARATIASLQDEVAMLSKSRDTWKVRHHGTRSPPSTAPSAPSRPLKSPSNRCKRTFEGPWSSRVCATLACVSRPLLQDTATQQEVQLRELYVEGEARAGELSRLRGDAQVATTEASGAVARLKLLESQLQVRHRRRSSEIPPCRVDAFDYPALFFMSA